MSKIVVIGSLNMDLMISTDRMPHFGETVTGHSFATIPGGKGANQSVACAKLGADTTMIGRVGKDDFGNKLIDSLNGAGVNTNTIITDTKESTGIAMIVVSQGENMIVLSEGSNGKLSIEDVKASSKIIESGDIILLQLEIPMETVEYIINEYKDEKIIALDPAPIREINDETINGLYFITPNEHEAEILCNEKIDNEEGLINGLNILREKGVKYPIITLGDRGVAYYNGEENKIVEAYKVDVVDTTAAGDTFNGGLVTAISNGKTIDEAIVFAQKAAALATTRYGAQTSIPSKNDVDGHIF